MAGDVMTTAMAGAEGAARDGESAASAQLNGQEHGETSPVTATGPQAGAPGNVQVPARPARPAAQRAASGAPPLPPGAGRPPWYKR